MRSERARRLVVPAILLVSIWIAVLLLGKTEEHPVAFVVLYGLAFLAYLYAVVLVIRTPRGPGLTLVLGVGLALRLIALPATPSDDMNRYLFEAEVVRAGGNPYAHAPSDPAVADLAAKSEWSAGINHRDWTAIYPPLTMLWQTAFGFGVLPLKLSFLLAEAGVAAMILLLLKERGMDPQRVLVYVWNPLTVLSTAHQGHNDALAVCLLLLAVWLAGRPARAGAAAVLALTGSVLAKLVTAVAAPALAPRVRGWAWILAIPVLVALWLPFAGAGTGVFSSFVRFGGELAYNGSVFALLDAALPDPMFARILAGALFLGVAAFGLLRTRPDPAHRAAFLLAGLLLFLPTVHTWYLTWLLPFLCLSLWLGWIFLSGTCILPHLAHLEIGVTGIWCEWKGLTIPEYAPLFIWLTWVALRGRVGRRQGAA